MGMESVGTTINRGGLLAKVTNISLPDDVVNEINCSSLDSTREEFMASALKEGQMVTFDIRLTKDAAYAVEAGTENTGTVITTSGGSTYTFDEFCKSATGGTADYTSTEGITQTIELRLTSEVVFVAGV